MTNRMEPMKTGMSLNTLSPLLSPASDQDRARLSANLGNLYHRLGQHPKAVHYQNAAIEFFRGWTTTAAWAHCYLPLGAFLSLLIASKKRIVPTAIPSSSARDWLSHN